MTAADGRPPGFAPLVLGCLLLSAVAFFVRSGRPGLLEKDEPRYAGTAREMVRGGDWLVPRFNGRERLVKPPLAYWAIAASFLATGSEGERAARLPSAVAAALTVLLTAWIGIRALGSRWGGLAGPILATMLLFLVEGRLATTDMPFTLSFTAAAAALVPVLEGSPRPGRWILLSGTAAGLASLAKTPLAILLPPAAALAAVLLLARRGGIDAVPPAFRPGSRGRTSLLFLGAVLLCAAVLASWVLAAEAATGGRLVATLRDQAAMRVENPSGFHYGPPWYYLPILLGGALPWTLLLPAGIGAAWRERRNPSLLYALAWAAAVLLFFSALAGKLASYLLPAFPALAVLAAAGLRELFAGAGGRAAAWARWGAGAGGLAAAAVLAAMPALPVLREKAGPASLADAAPAISVFAGLLGLGGILALARRPRGMAAALLAAPLSLVITAGPVLDDLGRVRSAKGMGEAVLADGLRPGDLLVDATNELTGLPWYADHHTVTDGNGEGPPFSRVAKMLAAGGRVYAVLEHDPAAKRAKGRRTQWERLLDRWPEGVPAPRPVFLGMERVVLTTAPPPQPPTPR